MAVHGGNDRKTEGGSSFHFLLEEGDKGGHGPAGPQGHCNLVWLQETRKKIETGYQGHWAKLKDWIGGLAEIVLKFILDFGFKNQRIQNIFKLKFEMGSNWDKFK
jgi:hypothetical protein